MFLPGTLIFWDIFCFVLHSERADTDMYRLSADISVIGRYIGLADKANAYRYRLSVSADKLLHIGF